MQHSLIVRPWLLSPLLVLAIIGGSRAWAADPETPPAPEPRRAGPRVQLPPPPTGTLIKLDERSITVRPLHPGKGGAGANPAATKSPTTAPANPAAAPATRPAAATTAPADLTFAIDKDKTRVAIESVMAERMTTTGQRVRSLRYDRGELADLEVGQLLTVTSSDGLATSIAIVTDPDAPRRGPGTIVKIEAKSITVRPGEILGGGNIAPGGVAAPPPPEVTYTTDPQQTRVLINAVTAERQLANGRVQRSISITHGTLDDLKVGQFVEVRARKNLAAEIRVVPDPAPPAAPGQKPAAKPEGAK